MERVWGRGGDRGALVVWRYTRVTSIGSVCSVRSSCVLLLVFG